MQTFHWYVRRLSSMSPGEIAWRIGAKSRDALDRVLLPMRDRLPPVNRIACSTPGQPWVVPPVFGSHLEEVGELVGRSSRLRDALVAKADRIAEHHLDLFDLSDHNMGHPIDWNYEHQAKVHAPTGAAATIDYRDYDSVGDCKFVWEPNRHQPWVVLARAYRATGDERYAVELLGQFESWVEQCPVGTGMNWRSPLELAIRLISWSWAFALIDDAAALTPARRELILQQAYLHLRDITRKYSRYSSANNHLVGEAAGVFVAASFFAGLEDARRWRAESKRILLREIFRQTHSDGGTREQATGYHLFVVEFFLAAGLVARQSGDDFAPEYWSRLEKMFEYVAGLSEGSGALPMIGDADDGYVLDVGGRDDPVSSLLAIGAVLFDRDDFKVRATEFGEAGLWLLGPEGQAWFDQIEHDPAKSDLAPRAFHDSGYYLLQRGGCHQRDRISLAMDCGPLGFLSIAAHGHADALSVVLRVAGVDVLVDPGTYDYFTHKQWREYFRSTCAHNTLTVDGLDQSQMLGSFLWGRSAPCRLVEWKPTSRGGTVIGEHSGYAHLSDPVTHRRTVTLSDDEDKIVVRDDIIAKLEHEVVMHWHLAEPCRVTSDDNQRFEIDFGRGNVVMEMDPTLEVTVVEGGRTPPYGWVSRGYHRKSRSSTIVGRCASHGTMTLTTRMSIHRLDSIDHGDASLVPAALGAPSCSLTSDATQAE